ncbi:2-phosphoglycerate kinase [Methanobrevibacter olleyae]|uniref:2-phosphoglycerate kinase n=1 Tax=Methanobrevibacter olleyae TaxID=294671 RepID=A0A126QZ54_METOL|nr:2-phosphoglycerate kinase [Methanobrevibacter olleyae]AMK14969.1 2-phosphoglycerate kinase Pgk2B [Methanobrevibacter olleyae]SFL65344.1 2-phosphoglycerate kinase [Methanobrevibacter olleyae]
MVLVRREVKGKVYTEPFSKGILSRSLIRAELKPNKAHEISNKIESDLVEKSITTISTNDLVNRIIELLEEENPLIAENYLNWRKIRNSDDPLIILIGGASGVGTSSISYEVSRRLGIKSMISTDMIREVMRKIVSKELSPVIHESSFSSQKGFRVAPPPEFDYVLAGFKDHVGTVSVGIEAVIERALTEGISIIIEGVHLVPGFIRKDLMDKDNVLMFTLTLKDEEMHKSRFYSRCNDGWASRPLKKYLDNFDSIRKTLKYMEDQAKKEGVPIIENVDMVETREFIIKAIAKYYGGLNDVRKD